MKVQGISVRKSRGESLFLVIASLSALLSVTVVSAAPLYFDSIEQLGLRRTLDRFEPAQMGTWLHVDEMTFNSAAIKSTVETAAMAGDRLGDTVRSRATFVRSGTLTLSRIGDRYAPPGSVLVYQSVEGTDPPISLVSGSFPSESLAGPLEIAVHESVAALYGIQPGDTLLLTVPPTALVHTAPTVTGIFRIDDPNDEAWQGLSSTLFDPEQGPTGGRPAIIAFTTNEMMERVAKRGIADIGEIWMMFYLDEAELKRIGAREYLEVVSRFKTDAAKLLPSSSTFSGIESSLRTLQRQLTFTNTTTIIAGALFAAFAIFVLALNASVVARRWLAEEVMLKVRGADRNQLLRSIAFYVLVLFLLPAMVGPILAALLVPILGMVGSFQELTGGEPFPFKILAEQYLWSGIVAGILLLLFAIPIVIARPGPIVRNFTMNRDSRSPWFWRANLDIGIVIAAAAVIFELNGRGSLFVQHEDGLSDLSVLATSLPILAAVAASLVALRLFRFSGVVLERLARANFHSMLSLALRVFSRSTMRHAVLMLLAAGTLIVVINASGLSATLGRNTSDRIDFATAADMRISGIEGFRTSENQAVLDIAELDWVSDHTWAARTEARTGPSESASEFTMLAVRPNEFAYIVKFRSDFADEPLSELMDGIEGYSATGSLALPDDISRLSAAVALRRTGKGRIDIWARLLDAEGTTHTIRMTSENGGQSDDQWHRVHGDVKAELPRPVRLLALEIYEPPTSPIGSAAELTVDWIRAEIVDGESTLITDFSEVDHWHPISTSIENDSRLTVVNEGIEGSDDGKSLTIEMGRGTDDGVRGVYYSENGPLWVPLLVNQALLESAGLAVGDRFTGQAYGRFVPFEIRGSFDLFSTMTDASKSFAVANVEALLSYLTPVSEPFLSNSAEMFVTVDNGVGHDERIAAIKNIDPSLRVADGEALHAQSSTRLGDAAGWRIVGTVIAVSTAVVAVVTAFAIAFHNQNLSRLDAALVESLGGSRVGVALEASTRIVISLCLGFALGLAGGIYSVRFIADRMTRTATGEVALPPMLLHMDWLPVIGVALLLTVSALIPPIWGVIRPKETIAVRIRTSSVT